MARYLDKFIFVALLHFIVLSIHTFQIMNPNLLNEISKRKGNAQFQIIKMKIVKNLNFETDEKVKKIINKAKNSKIINQTTAANKQIIEKKISENKVKGESKVDNKLKKLNSYVQELNRFINSKKFYPKQAYRLRQQGVVVISLKVLDDGEFQNITLKKESNSRFLNDAALKLVSSLRKFKPLPEELRSIKSFNVPIKYVLQ
jgi:protein TonB